MPTGMAIARLSVYRRLLTSLLAEGKKHIYSHELSALAGSTAAQVRRDLMNIGSSGSPSRGYDVEGLLGHIAKYLDAPGGQAVALVGVGHLGRAILAYFAGRRPNLSITAAFDIAQGTVNRVVHGCRCYPTDQLAEVIAREGIRVGIIAVPAQAAQTVADALVRVGVCGILSFAPVRLKVPPNVYLEQVDISVALEKVAFFARQNTDAKESLRC
jgi:redox-sensing transcriptional repressor